MRCVAISDTHGMYRDVVVPEGDVLIHAGDITRQGKLKELSDFNDWLAALPHRHKIVIAGNHDWCFQREQVASRALLTAAHYLQDERLELDGVCFYGSPWQPWFFDFAFNLQRGPQLKARWDLIPAGIDVLITHGPPIGILDQVRSGQNVGCEELLAALDRIRPRFHVFGHIHEGYGTLQHNGVSFLNASVNNERYQPVNPALVFEVA
jgi:Icc-related predicted phosphoesterase